MLVITEASVRGSRVIEVLRDCGSPALVPSTPSVCCSQSQLSDRSQRSSENCCLTLINFWQFWGNIIVYQRSQWSGTDPAWWIAAGGWVYLRRPQDGVAGVSDGWGSCGATDCGKKKKKLKVQAHIIFTISADCRDGSVTWECWYAAYCFNYCKMLFQPMP